MKKNINEVFICYKKKERERGKKKSACVKMLDELNYFSCLAVKDSNKDFKN